MSEKIVLFRDDQELQADDFTNVQTWLQEGLDHVVLDTINEETAYSGFTLTKASTTQINVAAGRPYDGGAVYARESTATLDLYSDLPVAQKKYFAIVCWGSTVDEDIQPRNFLIDADTGEAEPQSVAMQQTRYTNINYVKGTESADPQYPTTEATTLLLGYVLCDPTGILTVQQATANQINNLEALAVRVTTLEAWRAILAGQVDTLRTDLANLAKQLLQYTPLLSYQQLVNTVSGLMARVSNAEISIEALAATYLWYGTDNFFDEDGSDTDAVYDSISYAATINEGLRFPGANATTSTTLNFFNQPETLVEETYGGLYLPKPSGSRVRYDCSFLDTSVYNYLEHRLLAYAQSHVINIHNLHPSRWRWRCGPHFVPHTEAYVWWHEAWRDPCGHILQFNGETPWEAIYWSQVAQHHEDDIHWPIYYNDRWKYFWRDYVHHPYWDLVYDDYSHTANHMAQSFFNAQDGWLTSITLFMLNTSWGPGSSQESMRLTISGCDINGAPDHDHHTLRMVTLTTDQMQTCMEMPIWAGDIWASEVQANNWYSTLGTAVIYTTVFRHIPIYIYPVRIRIPAVFLKAGQHYAFHVHSTFDHKFSCLEHHDPFIVHQGHMWHIDSGGQWACWLNTARSFRFRLHFATWGLWGAQATIGGQLRYELRLQDLVMGGGIGSVDVLANAIVPDATSLVYEINSGAGWKRFDGDPNAPSFSGNPTTLQLRAVLTGTTDLMPAFAIGAKSQVLMHGGMANSFHHYSNPIAVDSPTSAVKVVVHIHGWIPSGAGHALDCHLNYGSPTKTYHDGTDDGGQIESDGSITRTWTFTTSALSEFVIGLHGTKDAGAEGYIVMERKVHAKIT